MPFHRLRSNAGAREARVPPGQKVTEKFPVLHYGSVPKFDPQTWDFKVFGLVEKPLTLSYAEFMALPTIRIVADIHCVTGWSKLHTVWEGVPFKEVMQLVQLKPEAGSSWFTVSKAMTPTFPCTC